MNFLVLSFVWGMIIVWEVAESWRRSRFHWAEERLLTRGSAISTPQVSRVGERGCVSAPCIPGADATGLARARSLRNGMALGDGRHAIMPAANMASSPEASGWGERGISTTRQGGRCG